MAEVRLTKYLHAYVLPEFSPRAMVGDYIPVDERPTITCTRESPFESTPEPIEHRANFKGYSLDQLTEVHQITENISKSQQEQIAHERNADLIAQPFGRFDGRSKMPTCIFYKIPDKCEEKLAKAPEYKRQYTQQQRRTPPSGSGRVIKLQRD